MKAVLEVYVERFILEGTALPGRTVPSGRKKRQESPESPLTLQMY